MVNQLVADIITARPDRHLQRIERQVSAQVVSDLPADNTAGKQVSEVISAK